MMYFSAATAHVLLAISLGFSALGCSPSVTAKAPQAAQSKVEQPIATKAEAPPSETKESAIDKPIDEPIDKPTDETTAETAVPETSTTQTADRQNDRQDLHLKFVDGDYRDGRDYNESGLEIKELQYRYVSEMGEQEWRSTHQLQFIKDGVVLDGKQHYWCLSSRIPPNPNGKNPVICSKEGWVSYRSQDSSQRTAQQNLPFVGTRRFNFFGGTGTGQSIVIGAHGQTMVRLHGTQSSSVEYDGEFTNPIVLDNGFRLSIQGDRIFSTGVNGEASVGCRSNLNDKNMPCVSDLY